MNLDMSKKDLVTIYITSFERPKSLTRAIESALHQSYSNIEIIVVDDGSKNFDVENYLKSYENLIILIKNTSSRGANHCRNLALNAATGKYITGLDDDDYFHSTRVEELERAYQNSNCSAVASMSSYYTPSKSLALFKLKNALKNLIIPNRQIRFSDIKRCNYLSNQVLTEVSKLKDIGGFDENLPSLQDWDTWFRLIHKHGPALKIGKVLYHCHESRDSISKRSGSKLEGHKHFYRKHGRHFNALDRKSFRLSLEYKRYGKVCGKSLYRNVHSSNISRVLYLLFFKLRLKP